MRQLRVWWIPQVPMKMFLVPVRTFREAKGTGKITLFTGIVDCKACKPKETNEPGTEYFRWLDKQTTGCHFVNCQFVNCSAVVWNGQTEREFYRALFGGE